MPKRVKYVEIEQDNGAVLRYVHHANGGGLVESSAAVDPTAFVAASAYVDQGAHVAARVRIGTGA